MTSAAEVAAQFGPIYPDLGNSVAKFRRLGSVAEMDKATRQAYGAAVEKAIRAKQRSELQRATGSTMRAFYPVGEALRQAHRARLQAAVAKERRDRTPAQWQEMYDQAMKEKHARASVVNPVLTLVPDCATKRPCRAIGAQPNRSITHEQSSRHRSPRSSSGRNRGADRAG